MRITLTQLENIDVVESYKKEPNKFSIIYNPNKISLKRVQQAVIWVMEEKKIIKHGSTEIIQSEKGKIRNKYEQTWKIPSRVPTYT